MWENGTSDTGGRAAEVAKKVLGLIGEEEKPKTPEKKKLR